MCQPGLGQRDLHRSAPRDRAAARRRRRGRRGLRLPCPSGDDRIPAARSCPGGYRPGVGRAVRSEEHTSELQSLMRISYAVFCLEINKFVYTTDTTEAIVER